MNIKSAMMLFRALNSPEGKAIVKGIKSGKQDFINVVLNSVGIDKPSPQDISELKSTVDMFEAPEEMSPQQSKKEMLKNAAEMAGHIRGVMVDSPQKLALKALVGGLSEGVNAAGDIAINNGNRLAAALLAARRTGTDARDQLYGKSARDRGSEAWAQDRIRRGENLGRGLKAVGNTIDKALGLYNAQDQMSKIQEASQYMNGVPGQIYQAMSSANTRLNKLGL